jgi:hypothetical protein
MPALRVLALTVLILAIALAGCGRESEDEKVRTTLEEFADATARKDYQALCDELFSVKLIAEVRRSLPCELALKRSDLASALKPKLEILSVKVDGDTARADVRSSAANQRPSRDTIELIREGEDWRIISLSSS